MSASREPPIVFTTGTLPSPKLPLLAASHPFTQQVDVLFPSSDTLEKALDTLKTCYVKTNARLSDMARDVEELARRSVKEEKGAGEQAKTMTVLCTTRPAFDDDRWCIDERGVLTLDVCAETYQRLGLVGTKIQSSGKKGPERRVIEASLRGRGRSVDTAERRQKMLRAWDAKRENEDRLGPWDVLYHGPSSDVTEKIAAERGHTFRTAEGQIRRQSNVRIPSAVRFSPAPSPARENHENDVSSGDEDVWMDWNHDISSILEWAGMACLGAQRLAANDRVDPYVAVYEPPSPWCIGDVTHLRWRGLLSPSFVQSVIDTAMITLSQTPTNVDSSPFVAIVCQTFACTPVSYIPASAFKLGGKPSLGHGMGQKGTTVQKNSIRGGTWCVVLAHGCERDASADEWGTWLKADNLEC